MMMSDRDFAGTSGANSNATANSRKSFTHVRVVHNFRGANNDELCMKKDDIITLTQTPSGGWWEGTLDGNTGWFPANHVIPILPGDPVYEATQLGASANNLQLISDMSGGSGPLSGQFANANIPSGSNDPASLTSLDLNGENITEYRAIVIKDIEDSENVFIHQLQDAISLYLKPMYHFPSDSEINAVLRSITEICSVHRRFLTVIDKNKCSSPKENRIGGLFLQFAPQFKHAHFEYCSHHARFVHLIEKYKKEICAFFAAHPPPPPTATGSTSYPPSPSMSAATASTSPANSPNVLITSSLSVSFRRLDKYPALLQELQRYTEENHVDRGDTQRAGFLYREISMSCLELRRRKEMELEVMLGNIRNFDGLKIETYGNITRMEPVSIMILPPWSEPKKDCYLVLFPKVLMVLSVGNELTSFSYESMLQLEGARIPVINFNDAPKQQDGYAYRLEIQGSSAHPLSDSDLILTYMVQFNDEEVWREWYQLLQKQIRLQSAASITDLSLGVVTPTGGILGSSSSSSLTTTSPPSASSSSTVSSPQSSSSSGGPIGLGKPPVVGAKPPHPPTPPPPPPIPPLPQHRIISQAAPPTPKTPSRLPNAQMSQIVPRRGSFWSDRVLTPHPPFRPDGGLTTANPGVPSTNPGAIALDPNEDIQLLNVIDAYYRKIPGSNASGKDSANNNRLRKLSNTNLPDLDQEQLEGQRQLLVDIFEAASAFPAHAQARNSASSKIINNNLPNGGLKKESGKGSLQALANKLNQLSVSNSSMDPVILYEMYDQLRQIRNEMTQLNESLKEERRQRKRLQDAVFHKSMSNSKADKKVHDKALHWEKALVSAEPLLEDYLRALKMTGKGDPSKYKALESAFEEIEVSKKAYKKALNALGKRWYHKKKYIAGATFVVSVAVGSAIYGIGRAFGWWSSGGDGGATVQTTLDFNLSTLIPSTPPFGSSPTPKFPITSAPSQSSDTSHITIWIVSIVLLLCALLFGGWIILWMILWNRNRSLKAREWSHNSPSGTSSWFPESWDSVQV